jgi:vacuolar-type H+-ATPase subunit I/STV1
VGRAQHSRLKESIVLRTFVVSKSTTLKSLTASLAGEGAGAGEEAPAARLATLQRLNPHVVDLDRIPAGTVLIVPDVPKARAESSSVAGPGFSEFAEQVRQAVAATSQRVGASYAALAEQQKEVAAALKSAAVKRQVDADADLQKQAKDAEAVFKADQQAAKAAQQTLEALHKEVEEELAALAKMFD